jgi:hypothetical protein
MLKVLIRSFLYQEKALMSHLKKLLLVSATALVTLTAVSSAGAASAFVTGGPNISGTSGTTLLKLHNAGVTLSCTNSSFAGVVNNNDGGLPLRIGTLTPGFSGCRIVGGLNITVKCQPSGLYATHTTIAGGHTPGSVGGISCHVFVTSQTGCRLTVVGAVGARHQNGVVASITVDSVHENLSTVSSTNGLGASCVVLPNDASARFTNAAQGDAVYSVSPSNLTVNVS